MKAGIFIPMLLIVLGLYLFIEGNAGRAGAIIQAVQS